MSVPAQIETPKAILLEMEIIFTVIATGAWGLRQLFDEVKHQ
jgi:hypothetical protein